MNAKRKRIEAYLLDEIGKLDTSGKNKQMYQNIFKNMSDVEFNSMMERIKEGESIFSIVIPNGDKEIEMDVPFLLGRAKALGIPVFEKVIFNDGRDTYMPDVKYMIIDMPVRRSSQHGLKGLSVAKHTRNRNAMTGQVSGKDSDSGSITLPEVHVLNGRGLKNTLKELLGTRGGDVKASSALRALMFKTGTVSKKELERFADKTGSTKSLKAIFKAMHIKINL